MNLKVLMLDCNLGIYIYCRISILQIQENILENESVDERNLQLEIQ